MQAEIVQWETEISAKCDYVINDISSMPTSAIIYDAYTSIIKKIFLMWKSDVHCKFSNSNAVVYSWETHRKFQFD